MRIGFAIENDCNSQLIHSIFEQTKYFIGDVILFCENKSKPLLNYNLSTFSIDDSFYFINSPLVATNIKTANSILTNGSNSKKYLYLYDLEWYKKINSLSYDYFESIYRNSKIDIIVENEEYAKLFYKCWNREPCSIIPNFDLNKLYRLYYGHTKNN